MINEDDLQRWQSEMDQYVNDKWKTIVPGVSSCFQLVRCSYAPSGECISDDCPKRLQLHLNYHQVPTGRIYLRPLNLGFFFYGFDDLVAHSFILYSKKHEVVYYRLMDKNESGLTKQISWCR